DWRRVGLLTGVSILAAVILISGIVSTVRLPLLGWGGLVPFLIIVAVTFASSRFTVPVTNVDGSSQSNKSIADTFIFLTVMMYAPPSANSFGPAILIAALVGLLSSLSVSKRWATVFAVGNSIISTSVASIVYRVMLTLIAGGGASAGDTRLVLD